MFTKEPIENFQGRITVFRFMTSEDFKNKNDDGNNAIISIDFFQRDKLLNAQKGAAV